MTAPDAEWLTHQLLHRYVAAVDAQDFDAIRACFGAHGTMLLRGVERRGDKLVDYYRAQLTFPTVHLVTGITVDRRPDGLMTAGCGLFAIEMLHDGWRGVIGRYDDVVRVDGRTATFVHRTVTISQRVRLSPEG